jgi:hypothetical protein
MGLFDQLFGEKIEIEFTDKTGTKRTRKVLRKNLNKWEREGKLSRIDTIRANIAGLSGVRAEDWIIGEYVTKETVAKFMDRTTGEIYVGEFLEKGDPKQFLMPKEKWEEFKKI